MIRINLLPYRTKLRQRQILFHVACFLVVIAAVVVLCIMANVYESMQLSSRLEKQEELALKIKKLDKVLAEIKELEAKRAEVKSKMDITDELQVGRYRSLNMLYEISRVIPKNVWIKSLSDGRSEITMKGSAGNSEGISKFMRSLEGSDYFQADSVRLGSVSRKVQKKIPIRVFDVRASFAKLEDSGKKGGK